jgi:hypothetical protein
MPLNDPALQMFTKYRGIRAGNVGKLSACGGLITRLLKAATRRLVRGLTLRAGAQRVPDRAPHGGGAIPLILRTSIIESGSRQMVLDGRFG